jgi:uncharacterized protein
MNKKVWLLLPFFFSFQVPDDFFIRLSEAAIERTTHKETYDGQYRKIKYPGGDVPDSIGVCTDVIIRSYRKVGTDLQVLIHEDMKRAKAEYDKRRKTDKLDSSIDHRRTQNMETFFTRHGGRLPISAKAEDYLPGDIVFFDVAYGHVGIVVNRKSADKKRYMIVHNIGRGSELEDFLFGATITGHYRWKP